MFKNYKLGSRDLGPWFSTEDLGYGVEGSELTSAVTTSAVTRARSLPDISSCAVPPLALRVSDQVSEFRVYKLCSRQVYRV